ncbi:MAG: selenide, water dikinase SelD [Halieaceae bacterium]|jgi:selenide,water dikinase|nr:selenide, water dikinase SelD [Halieaceae bacterium]
MAAPLRRDLVLLGGGHSHMLALTRLAMDPPAGARLTLVSDTDFAPYSGMLPGLVAGHYSFHEAHIDLRRFCSTRNLRFVRAAVKGIDPNLGRVHLEGRPPLEYDLLSINIGAQPELDSVPGASEYALPVKPVGTLYRRWTKLRERLVGAAGPLRIVLVGGGAGSVELAFAVHHRLDGAADVQLVCGRELLPGYNARVQKTVRQALARAGITLHEHSRVQAVHADSVDTGAAEPLGYDELLWCTGVAPAGWLKATGFPLDDKGFLVVDDTLQVQGHPGVFAAGDVAVQQKHPRPRAGVFAVRQAPVLAHNLAAAVAGAPLRKHRPQQMFLSLLSLGEKRAVAERGPLAAQGHWVWRWKDRIDRKFMERFAGHPQDMTPSAAAMDMHCGGCGAKLPADMLRQSLAIVASAYPRTVSLQRFQDDAAVVRWPAGSALVQSVDTLRALVDDVFLMGRIAAIHALSDLYAMGAEPHSAQAQLCLPYLLPKLQQRDLQQIMMGIAMELEQAGCQMVGGHSMEGPELSVGLTVNGLLSGAPSLDKQGGAAGDLIVLTKPLGTGVAYAAAMKGETVGETLAAAETSMLCSNAEASRIARTQQASACTDVTGFGLLCHLMEMLPSDLAAEIDPQSVPLLPGVDALLQAGYRSTMHDANVHSVRSALEWPAFCYDPQTSGGLLMFVSPARLDKLLEALHAAGYSSASAIGSLRARDGGEALCMTAEESPGDR